MYVTVAGRRARLATGGGGLDRSDPVVLFVHGSGGDRTVWQHQTRWFAHHGHRAVAVDLPGHGGSDGPPLETIEDMAEWIVALMGELDLPSAHVVGHSMGTYVALEVAAGHPELVRAIVLLGTATAMPVHPDLMDAARRAVPVASSLIVSWGLASRSRSGGHTAPGTWLTGATSAVLDRSAGALAVDLAACDTYSGALAAAAQVRCPATVVMGSEDRLTPPRAAAELVTALEAGRAVTLDGVGHFMHTEAPVATRRVVAEAVGASP